MTISAITSELLTYSKIKGVGPATLLKIYRSLCPNEFPHIQSTHIDISSPSLKSFNFSDSDLSDAKCRMNREIDKADELDVKIVSIFDDEYPSLLKKTKDRPFFLYIKGQLFSDQSKSIAIIGTRKPTKHGEEIASRITKYFSLANWSVVSGLAFGCDAIAHKSALEAGGHTVAVMAHGLHTVAPKSHSKLAAEIIERGGALVSEYGFDIEPQPFNFVKRDRIQAGLAAGVVMIQSDLIGGSLHASRAIIEYGRTLAVPHPTDKDIELCEQKIEANLLFASSDDEKRASLLKCNRASLENLFIVNSKSDYPKLLSLLINRSNGSPDSSDEAPQKILF